MAEYCSQCSPFKDTNDYDIDLIKLALKVKRGYSINFLCEGCNNRGIYKDENGLLYLAKLENNKIELYPVRIEDL